MTKLIDAFRNFVNTPENELIHGVFRRYKVFPCKKLYFRSAT